MSVHQPVAPAAPPRSKRRWRYLVGFLLLAIAAPFGYYHVGNWLRDRELEEIYREMDAEDPNWRWADLVAEMPAPPPDEQNAAVQVVKVGDLLEKTPYTRSTILAGRVRNARLSEEQLAIGRTNLKKAGVEALEQAHTLKDMPEGRVPLQGTGNPLKEPDISAKKRLNAIYFLQHDAVLRSQEPDKEGAGQSCQAILNATRSIEDHPTVFSLMICQSGQVCAVDTIEYVLGQGTISPQRLQALQDTLQGMADRNALHSAFRGERAMSHQVYLLIQTGEISEADIMGRNPTFKDRVRIVFSGWHMSDYATEMRLKNEQVRATKLRDEAQIEAQRVLEAKIKKLQTGSKMLFSWDTMFLGFVLEHHKVQVRMRCAIVALAAERYRLEHKSWPSGMAELVTAGFLKEVLKDPYDGQPLRWKSTADHLVIYSVGEKKIDDGGQINLFNTRMNGLGFVLWMPHLRHMPPPEVEENPKTKKK